MAVKKFVADGSMYVWALLRMALGFTFLWAFIDKLLGLGFATCKDQVSGVVTVGCNSAWVNGGSPTTGFLGSATTGPLTDFYQGLAGMMWVDWLFMLGLLFVGVGLLFGTWIRAAAFAGIIMLVMIWSALLWPTNTPLIDEHLIYALVLFGIALTSESHAWSMHSSWVKTSLAKSLKFLR